MNHYQKLYHYIFNRCTDVIEEMKSIQQEVEEMCLQSSEMEVETVQRKEGQDRK